MAEAFRSQLLRDVNRVQPSGDQPCMICLTQCDTLCPETGSVEWEIVLPCKHTVGSICIIKWLDPSGAANNTCPMCRYVFFPQQPQPNFDLGFFDGDDLTPAAVLASHDSEPVDTGPAFTTFEPYAESDISSESEWAEDGMSERGSNDLPMIRNLGETYCRSLDFAPHLSRVMAVTEHLAWKNYQSWLFAESSGSHIVAFTVLAVSHIMGVPRSLFQVSRATLVDDHVIFGLYRLLRRSRGYLAELLDEEALGIIDRGDFETVSSYLPEVPALFFPEESDALIARGGIEAYDRSVW